MAVMTAAMLGCAATELTISGGDRIVAADGRSLALSAVARHHAPDGGLVAHGTFSSTNRTYSYGAHAAHVAVDPRTNYQAQHGRFATPRGGGNHEQQPAPF